MNLIKALKRIRERGYAIDNEEKIQGLKCVTAPVTGPNGQVLGAVSVSGSSSRMEGERFNEEIPKMVTRSTTSSELTHSFPKNRSSLPNIYFNYLPSFNKETLVFMRCR